MGALCFEGLITGKTPGLKAKQYIFTCKADVHHIRLRLQGRMAEWLEIR